MRQLCSAPADPRVPCPQPGTPRRQAIVLGAGVPWLMFLAWEAACLGSSGVGLLGGVEGAGIDPLAALRQSANPAVAPLLDSFIILTMVTSFIAFVLGLTDFIADALQASPRSAPCAHQPPAPRPLPAERHSGPCSASIGLCNTLIIPHCAAAHRPPARALPAHVGATTGAGAVLPGGWAGSAVNDRICCLDAQQSLPVDRDQAGSVLKVVRKSKLFTLSCAHTASCRHVAGCLLLCTGIRWHLRRACSLWSHPSCYGVERAVCRHHAVAHPSRARGQARVGADSSSCGGCHCARAVHQRRSAGGLSTKWMGAAISFVLLFTPWFHFFLLMHDTCECLVPEYFHKLRKDKGDRGTRSSA